MKKVAILTTIFPMKELYINDFFHSLENQTYKNFDIIVVNDGYKNLLKFIKKYSNLNIIEIKSTDTPAKNREFGINYCISKGYDTLIFGDSDDYFSNNRIEYSITLLNDNNIIVNDLTLVNNSGIYCKYYLSNRLDNNSKISYEFIKDKNIFGLSNTAINLNILDNVIFEKDLIAVDWYLFKKLLQEGNNGIFTNKIETYYRQYENNLTGLNSKDGKFLLWWEKS